MRAIRTFVMRILPISDLHLNHRPYWHMPERFPAFDVAVFAGDVDGTPEEGIATLLGTDALLDRPVVFVAGNHEFYGHVVEDEIARGKAASAGTRVHLLDMDSVAIGGVRFVGATLWTDYRLFGDPDASMVSCHIGLNDHRLIGTRVGDRKVPFTPAHALERHVRELAYLRDALATPFDGRTVVVTHHGPHPNSVHPRYRRNSVSPGFVSDLTGTILEFGPDLWIHGHVHDGFDYVVGRTRIVANPKGYGPLRNRGPVENATFDENMIVEI